MRIKSKTELKDLLDKDYAWRLRELSHILNLVKNSEGKTLDVSIRTSILLLYAHWEGFIKNASSYYLNYVKHQNLAYQELVNCFVAVALKQKIKTFEQTNKSTVHTQFVEYFKSNGNQVAEIYDIDIIKTGSNLNSIILKEILTTIGIDFKPFDLKVNLIDEQLLNYRNTIAHGEFLKVQQKDYKKLHNEIFIMMRTIKDEIENAVILETYKIAN